MEKEENFYHELDKKTKKRSYCTCQTLVIFFVLLAIALAVGVTATVKKIATVVMPQRQVTATTTDADSLQQKIADLAQAPGASTSLTITEQELTGLLVSGINNQPTIPLRDIQAQINPTEVVLTGTLTEYIKSSVALSLVPKVVDGKMKFELAKVQAGSLSVPSYVTERLAEQVDLLTEKQSDQFEGVMIKSIRLDEGRMIITGTITDPS
jgi:hypothetical protein